MTEEDGREADAMMAQLIADTPRLQRGTLWFPLVATAGLFAS